ncbi:hypothetical protein M409DRAFT_66073 [Zasmidium cellare ATCC 36951]|uniref:Major facilitator superfamily (MFS) profile domain-containing protein n=1 Tax=Zasmidium cellare ATCC 36951 TaxID=1080233 RepID=A0A6A6CNR8_ZASCE|nr:uncharacterized protein M409DRAFT_66073 [Zasmidium cellare ATCC 36951]KAF2167562.1 hypothetical protein M409DRAFT_66073 [Zasmidium cellare ATCC 36951]
MVPDQRDADGETEPLLSRRRDDGRGEDTVKENSRLSSLRRPAVLWILIPITLLTAALGGANPSKQVLILDLVCRDYRTNVDGNEDICRSPAVSSRFSLFSLYIALLSGLLLIFSVPRLCTLSDRWGRRLPLMVAVAGTIASEIITLFAATYPNTFPTILLLLGAALEGATGSVLVTTSVAGSYIRDCTKAEERNTAFAYLHGCLAVGLTVGPSLAGLAVDKSGTITVVFYMLVGIHSFVLLFLGFLVPESLPEESRVKRDRESDEHNVREEGNAWFSLKPFSSSAIIRRNILCLAVIDAIVFGVGLGSASIVPYANLRFAWKSVELGYMMTVSHGTGILANFLLLPLLTSLFQSKDSTSPCTTFDITLIRSTLLITAFGYFGYAVSPSGAFILLSSAIVWLGSIAAPVVQSSLTKHVSAERTGALLGVIGQLHACGRILFPVIFNGIYAITVESAPWLVFALLAVVLVLGIGVSLGVWIGGEENDEGRGA